LLKTSENIGCMSDRRQQPYGRGAELMRYIAEQMFRLNDDQFDAEESEPESDEIDTDSVDNEDEADPESDEYHVQLDYDAEVPEPDSDEDPVESVDGAEVPEPDPDGDPVETVEESNPATPPPPPVELEEEPAIERPTTSHRAQQLQQEQHVEAEVINLNTPSPPKKRKRLSPAASHEMGTPVAKPSTNDDDEDDGMTCPICLESWEMSGEHRLVSLRCGHLFGESCIRRWLLESQRQSAVKVCPQCKTKATNRDIRCLYAKRLRAIDRTEEHDMRRELDAERRRIQSLTTELATITCRINKVQQTTRFK